ncbi:uncharacterized protein LOC143305271 [Osmia lignaria lignaria]|uniref:uncharacterized protein LOC143305271 n=1 Tax=Osmia lignaria lignaria TaxID=1437193 RepID=UPI00402B0741
MRSDTRWGDVNEKREVEGDEKKRNEGTRVEETSAEKESEKNENVQSDEKFQTVDNDNEEKGTAKTIVNHTFGRYGCDKYCNLSKGIVTYVNDYSRLAMAFSMRATSETGCYFEIDQGTEYTGGCTLYELGKLETEHHLSSPDTPEHNGVAKQMNQIIQKKAYTYGSKLPENMWDLALGAAIHAYNGTLHKANKMVIPLAKPGAEVWF